MSGRARDADEVRVEGSGMTLVAPSVPSSTTSPSAETVSMTDKFREAVGRHRLSLVFFVANGGCDKRSVMDTAACTRTLRSPGRCHLLRHLLCASSEAGGCYVVFTIFSCHPFRVTREFPSCSTGFEVFRWNFKVARWCFSTVPLPVRTHRQRASQRNILLTPAPRPPIKYTNKPHMFTVSYVPR